MQTGCFTYVVDVCNFATSSCGNASKANLQSHLGNAALGCQPVCACMTRHSAPGRVNHEMSPRGLPIRTPASKLLHKSMLGTRFEPLGSSMHVVWHHAAGSSDTAKVKV